MISVTPKRNGLVWGFLTGETEAEVFSISERARELVSPGRTLAFLWEETVVVSEPRPYEAWTTKSVLGAADQRTENSDFRFFGNIFVRSYGKDLLSPIKVLNAILFRRVGEPPYRRKSDPEAPAEIDRLDTRAVAFTRDWANNVWHLPDRPHVESQIIARVARLVAWSDERVLKITNSGTRDTTALRERHFQELIPVAMKIPYDSKSGHQDKQLQIISVV